MGSVLALWSTESSNQSFGFDCELGYRLDMANCCAAVRAPFIARALTEPVWWFYLFWAPKFLSASRGITLSHVGLPLVTMYLMANAGGLVGGWISSSLLKHGWSINSARKAAVLICALWVVRIAFDGGVATVHDLGRHWHPRSCNGWSRPILMNLFAMLSDIYQATQ